MQSSFENQYTAEENAVVMLIFLVNNGHERTVMYDPDEIISALMRVCEILGIEGRIVYRSYEILCDRCCIMDNGMSFGSGKSTITTTSHIMRLRKVSRCRC